VSPHHSSLYKLAPMPMSLTESKPLNWLIQNLEQMIYRITIIWWRYVPNQVL